MYDRLAAKITELEPRLKVVETEDEALGYAVFECSPWLIVATDMSDTGTFEADVFNATVADYFAEPDGLVSTGMAEPVGGCGTGMALGADADLDAVAAEFVASFRDMAFGE